jgi:predicted outer membrane repeat protein
MLAKALYLLIVSCIFVVKMSTSMHPVKLGDENVNKPFVCAVQGGDYGGAILGQGLDHAFADIHVEACQFKDNTAFRGGAIYIENANLTTTSTNMTGNLVCIILMN